MLFKIRFYDEINKWWWCTYRKYYLDAILLN